MENNSSETIYYPETSVTIQKVTKLGREIGWRVTDIRTGEIKNCLTFGEAVLKRRELLDKEV